MIVFTPHYLIQGSIRIRCNHGRVNLLQIDMTRSNQLIRGLIGEPQYSILDVVVANAVSGPAMQLCLPSLLHSPFSITGRDPMWENAQLDQYDVQLGAMGVVPVALGRGYGDGEQRCGQSV